MAQVVGVQGFKNSDALPKLQHDQGGHSLPSPLGCCQPESIRIAETAAPVHAGEGQPAEGAAGEGAPAAAGVGTSAADGGAEPMNEDALLQQVRRIPILHFLQQSPCVTAQPS